MDAIIESAKGSIEMALGLPILLVLLLAMIILCIMLKKTPLPRWIVYLLVVLLPSFLVCFCVPVALKLYQEMWSPVAAHCIRCSSIGLLLGFVALGLHRPFTKLMEKLIPGFSTEDTEFIDKP